ncbi:MAG: ABC transporter permease [Alistipes sp.]|nr:ABC transporter permease [Alistipes sp.]
MSKGYFFSRFYLWLLIGVLYLPILIIMIFSFSEAKVLGNWTGFSTRLYTSLFSSNAHHALFKAMLNTLVIAVIASTISMMLGTVAALGISKLRERQRKMIAFFNNISIINPDIITAISLFLLFVSLGVSQGYTTVILAHITFCTPFVVLCVLPRLSSLDSNLYEAALDLGATPGQAVRKVVIPEIRPGMISGWIVAFTLSIDDFAVTLFTSGSEGLETLSTYIYADARKGGLTPELRALSTLIFVTVLLLLLIINYRSTRQRRREKRDSVAKR